MKIKIKTQLFQEYFKNAHNFVNKGNKIPILSNILIEAHNNKITLTGTDLITEGIINIENNIEILEEGAILTNTEKLLDILKLSNKKEIILETEDTSLLYSDENSLYELYTFESENFSKFNIENELFEIIKINRNNLLKSLKETVFSTAFTSQNQCFTGINIKKSINNNLIFIGSDNFRLSLSYISTENEVSNNINIIIPKKTVLQIIKFLELYPSEEPIDLNISQKFISIKINNNITINSKLIEQKYLEVENMLPSEFNYTLSINKENFFNTLRKASILISGEDKSIMFDIQNNNITFYSENSLAGRGKNSLTIDYKYDPIKFFINPRFLFEFEEFIKSDEIIFKLTDDSKPILLEDKKNTNFKYFIQPISIIKNN